MIHNVEDKTKKELVEIVKIQIEEYQLLQKRLAEVERERDRYRSLLISLKHDKSKMGFKINSALSEFDDGML